MSFNNDLIGIEYLAGFIDGEGCLTMSVRASRYLPQPHIGIVNTNKSIMVGIKYAFDSSGIESNLRCNLRQKRGIKPIYSVTVDKIDSVYELLIMLYPFLKVKQERARIIIDYIRRRRTEPHHTVSDDFKKYAFSIAGIIKIMNI